MKEEKKKILIVEDDSFVMDIYRTKLIQEGMEVETADNGMEALKKIEKLQPDLILLDIVMPYVDGLEVLKKVRAMEDKKNIPIVLLTNLSQKEEVDQGLALGANDYLIKSHFTPSEVLEKINKYINKPK
ncbi:MAG TPA: response regulator [Patescibacteria group bacterium]|nr:response regulator [Patescibacteria group bacterium]